MSDAMCLLLHWVKFDDIAKHQGSPNLKDAIAIVFCSIDGKWQIDTKELIYHGGSKYPEFDSQEEAIAFCMKHLGIK
jgi:hypothetical protein